MYLLGITGKARAGKDTAAAFFSNPLFNWRRAAHADALKRMAAAMVNDDLAAYHSDHGKEEVIPSLGITRRALLQNLGSDIKRSLGDTIWSRLLMQQVDGQVFGSKVVITDVRYDFEAQPILDRGGFILEIRRRGAGLTGAVAQHHSEAGISSDLIDFSVDNDGTIGELYAELDKIRLHVEGRK